MIFKVLYQKDPWEVPVRESTKALYVEGETIQEVRRRLADRKLKVEHVQMLDEAHLEYEKQSEDFKLEKI